MILTLPVAEKLLKKYGIPVVEEHIATNVVDAIRIARKFGYPVAIKDPAVIHKMGIGAVFSNVMNEKAVKEAFDSIDKEKVLVQKHMDGIELMVGAATDPQFGKFISFGLGGDAVELFKDVSFRVLPVSVDDVREMITETKSYKLLKSSSKTEMEVIENIIVSVARMVEQEKISEMDINPLIANSHGVRAVDVRISFEK